MIYLACRSVCKLGSMGWPWVKTEAVRDVNWRNRSRFILPAKAGRTLQAINFDLRALRKCYVLDVFKAPSAKDSHVVRRVVDALLQSRIILTADGERYRARFVRNLTGGRLVLTLIVCI